MASDPHPNGVAARQLWLAIAGMGLTLLLSGMMAVFWVGGIAYSVGQNARDIQNIGLRLTQNDTETHELQITAAKLQSTNVEIESQFRAFDQLSDIRIAEDLRWRCQFLEKLYKQRCADIAYFPQIARPNPIQ